MSSKVSASKTTTTKVSPKSSPMKASAADESRFGKLRSSARKGDVITVIEPKKTATAAKLASHFPNATKKLTEFQGKKVEKVVHGSNDSIFRRIANTIGVAKDKDHEIEESDLVHWRRAHIAASDKSKAKAGAARGTAFIDARKARLQEEGKAWKQRLVKASLKEKADASGMKKAIQKAHGDADARRTKRITDMTTKLAAQDKDRQQRAKKALAAKKAAAKK